MDLRAGNTTRESVRLPELPGSDGRGRARIVTGSLRAVMLGNPVKYALSSHFSLPSYPLDSTKSPFSETVTLRLPPRQSRGDSQSPSEPRMRVSAMLVVVSLEVYLRIGEQECDVAREAEGGGQRRCARGFSRRGDGATTPPPWPDASRSRDRDGTDVSRPERRWIGSTPSAALR